MSMKTKGHDQNQLWSPIPDGREQNLDLIIYLIHESKC